MRAFGKLIFAAAAGVSAITCSPAQAAPGCLPFANCIDDKLYHPVTKNADGNYQNKRGADAVMPVTMYAGPHGWGITDPRLKKTRQPRSQD